MPWLQKLRRQAASWAARGIDLVCPPRCAICGGEPPAIDGAEDERPPGVFVCPACERNLVDPGPRCVRCARPGRAGADCDRCQRRRPPWDGLVILGGYDADLRQAVLRAKRPGAEPVAAALGRLLGGRHRAILADWGSAAVVPVPMHWSRRAARGASAAEEMARQLAADIGVPCRRLLCRVRATRMQNELPFADRHANVRGAFGLRGAVAGLRLLLVDDVVTSGGTLAECRRILADAGAAAVHAAAATRAERDADDGVDHE